MLRISKMADYGAVIMHSLSAATELMSSRAIANQVQLTSTMVSKVLKRLVRAGLVDSERGVNGGYRLSRSAEQIRVAQIIAAVEQLPAMTDCCAPIKHCQHDTVCSMRSNWQYVNGHILEMLNQITLADMMGNLADHPFFR